jgi:hypothetical protein
VPGLLADAVAAVHLAAVLTLVVGGLLALRWRRLVWVHVPVAAAVAVVNRLGADCPLTELELSLRARAGENGYGNGFIGHYLVEPLHPAGITPGVQVLIYAVAVVPNVLAYGVIGAAAWRRRRGPHAAAQAMAMRGRAEGRSQRRISTMADSGTETHPVVGPEPVTCRKMPAPR